MRRGFSNSCSLHALRIAGHGLEARATGEKKNPPELANIFAPPCVLAVEARAIRRTGFRRSTGGGSLRRTEAPKRHPSAPL
jgi:hypothetical protein